MFACGLLAARVEDLDCARRELHEVREAAKEGYSPPNDVDVIGCALFEFAILICGVSAVSTYEPNVFHDVSLASAVALGVDAVLATFVRSSTLFVAHGDRLDVASRVRAGDVVDEEYEEYDDQADSVPAEWNAALIA